MAEISFQLTDYAKKKSTDEVRKSVGELFQLRSLPCSLTYILWADNEKWPALHDNHFIVFCLPFPNVQFFQYRRNFGSVYPSENN